MPSFVPYLIHTLFPPGVRRPTEIGAEVMMLLGGAFIVYWLVKYKKLRWLWDEWLTTVDHKKIGIMYLVAAIVMLFRGGLDALMLRTNLLSPTLHFVSASEYNQLFTTHGTIMVFFMAMPFIFALFNVVVPLQIGARDVAFPRLNAISFWLFAFAAALFNLSAFVGGSPNAGWTAYPPLTELAFNHSVGENYYFVSLLMTGIGTTITGINFLVTILRMRAPGMSLMKMPLFTWATLNTSVLILFAFPPLTIALLETLLDRLAGTSFFTLSHGGMPMMYVNLFWLFGHPEVYILVLPAFGVFSEVVATFARKRLFGYPSMVLSMTAIMVLAYGTWVHHFFTMGAGPAVNAFFGLSTMLIAIPTGVKVFNWIFTMWGGRIRINTAMLYFLAFIPTFVIGGATGIMLAAVPVDYQVHNSYFLVAHFHEVLIGGTVFGLLAGVYYWWPKMFGYKLNDRQGRWAFWLFAGGFWPAFIPQYWLGLEGMTRRMYTYPFGFGWQTWNDISTVGGFIMGAGFLVLVYNVLYSRVYGEKDATGDPWDGRTLEWSIPSPAPEYNFAVIPTVDERDWWWQEKERRRREKHPAAGPKPEEIRPIAIPKNTPVPVLLGAAFFLGAFGLVFSFWDIVLAGLIGVFAVLIYSWFQYDHYRILSAAEVRESEAELGRLDA